MTDNFMRIASAILGLLVLIGLLYLGTWDMFADINQKSWDTMCYHEYIGVIEDIHSVDAGGFFNAGSCLVTINGSKRVLRGGSCLWFGVGDEIENYCGAYREVKSK